VSYLLRFTFIDALAHLLDCRYPGVACDIPSVSYQFTWEPHIWPEYYSSGHEIRKYLRSIVDKYELLSYINLKHIVREAEGFEDKGQWKISVENHDGYVFEDWCHIFLNGGSEPSHI
jgi:cation diffusion facilitator CzcD-associated flavoprotein CzcO